MIIRRATAADLDAMTWVLIGASPLDPIYPYRFPDRHLYPSEFAALCRRKCAEYLETSTVVVCEMPVDPGNEQDTRVVAFAAWDMPSPVSPSSPSSSSCLSKPTSQTESPPRTLGNLTRQQHFRATLAHWKATLFDANFSSSSSSSSSSPTSVQITKPRPRAGQCAGGRGRGHVFLRVLLTHPSHQRRGAGTALVRWGVAQARDGDALGGGGGGLPATVFASPMGRRLYRRLGFVEVARFRVQLPGEGEYVEIPAMVLFTGGTGSGGGAGAGSDGREERALERGVTVAGRHGMSGGVMGTGRRRVAGECGSGYTGLTEAVVGCA